MLHFNRDSFVDITRYEEELRYIEYIPFDREGMLRQVELERAKERTWYQYLTRRIDAKTSRKVRSMNKKSLIKYLQMYERCPEAYFRIKNSEGQYIESIEKKKVLEKLYGNGYAVDFLDEYFTYVRHKSVSGTIENMLERNTSTLTTDRNGKPLGGFYFDVNRQFNWRFNYKNEDIIGIPREYHSCLYAEKGYFYAWGDFMQSDLRFELSLFLIESEEDAKIFLDTTDVYKAVAMLVAKFVGKKFDEEEFMQHRAIYKELCLATVYGTRNSVVSVKDEFVKTFTKYIFSKKKYAEYCNRILDRHLLGKRVDLVTYFGNYETIDYSSNESTFLNQALNTPGQMGTAELMILSILRILDRFRELGYRKSDVCIAMSRHDEPVLRLSTKCVNDLWLLKDSSLIEIPGFMPLRMEFSLGYQYKVEDEALKEHYQTSCIKNSSKINTDFVYKKVKAVEDFYPVPAVVNLKMHALKLVEVDTTIVAIYNHKLNKVHYSAVSGTSHESLNNYMRDFVRQIEPISIQKGYKDMLITSNFLLGDNGIDSIAGRTFVKFRQYEGTELSIVDAMTCYMANLYCKKHNIACPVNLPTKDYEEAILNVEKSEVGDII